MGFFARQRVFKRVCSANAKKTEGMRLGFYFWRRKFPHGNFRRLVFCEARTQIVGETSVLRQSLTYCRPCCLPTPVASRQISVDEAVKIAVHDCVDVRVLEAGTGILHKGIGHEDVGADLAAPLDLLLNALDVGDLLEVLALLDLDQLGRSMRRQFSLFWSWLRSVWQATTMPVALWMSRTAEEVLLMC